ncbi:MAG TPA: CHAT domain-containing tetratricopeptide repeat protein [Cyclobacteriaceae bacterium]
MRLVVSAFCFLLIPFFSQAQPGNTPAWKALYDSGNFFLKTDPLRSVKLFSRSELVARNDLGIYDDNYLVILNGLGLAYEYTRNFEQARKYLAETVSLGREIYPAEDPRILQSQLNLGMLYRKAGNLPEAKKIFHEVLTISLKTSQRNLYAQSGTQLVGLLESFHELDSALMLSRAIIASPMLKDYESNTYELRLAEGRILRKEKMYDYAGDALTALNKQLIARGSAFRTLSRSVNVQLALLDTDLGLYSKAEKDLLQLYRLVKAESGDNSGVITETTNALGFVYEKLGVYDKAIAYYEESLDNCLATTTESIGRCDAIQNNIAGIYVKQHQFDKAISQYRLYVDSRKDNTRYSDRDFLAALNNLASALRQTDRYNEALQYLNDIYRSLASVGRDNDDLAATVLNNIAVTETMTGQYTKATEHFQKVLKIKESFYGTDSPSLLDICGNLAVSLWASGKRSEALPYFERSLRLGLREVQYNFQNLTETEQVQFYSQQKENFERFNTLAIQSSKETPAMLKQMFNNQVFLKSLVFFTNRKTTTLAKELKDPKLKKVFELKQARSAQLGNYYQTPIKELEEQHISLGKVESEIDSLDKIVRHTLSMETPVDNDARWNSVQSALGPDEASIDVIRFRKYDVLPRKTAEAVKIKIGFTDSVYYAVLITTAETKERPDLVLLKNGHDLETKFYNYYKNTTRFDVNDSISTQQYWAPIERKIAGKKKVFFSPDGVFRQINLNTLRGRDGLYNIENYHISLGLNPAGVVLRKNTRPVNLSRLTLMGDPVFGSEAVAALPGTREEITEIARIIKPVPTQYIKSQASEQNLRKVSSPSVLHIATHGFFGIDLSYINEQVKADYLFHSGLVLSTSPPASTESDGIVTAYDILNLDLRNTDLVVLSACETGLGKNEYGEGIHGLQRSFLQAGAKEIVISLWRVDDRVTKDLMIRFYHTSNKRKMLMMP